MKGEFIDEEYMGDVEGDCIGHYDLNDESWTKVGVGVWKGEHLAFMSKFESSPSVGSAVFLSGIWGGVYKNGINPLWIDGLASAKFIGVIAEAF